MTLDRWLTGRARWLINPVPVSWLLVAACVALDASFTLGVSADVRHVGLLELAVCVAGALGVGEWLVGRQVRALRALRGSREPALRSAAILEAQRLPSTVVRIGALVWLVAGGALCVMLWVSGAPGAVVGRLALMLALWGPMSLVLSAVLVSRRAQAVVERLATGAEGGEQVGGTQSAGAGAVGVRASLIAYTVVMAALPAAMLLEAGFALVNDAVTTIGATGREGAEAALASGRLTVVLELGLLAGLALAIALCAAWVGATSLVEPLQRLSKDAAELAQGTLARVGVAGTQTEVIHLAGVFGRMKERLLALISQLKGAGGEVTKAARTLQDTGRRYEHGASEQAAALNETSATTEQLAQSARQIAVNAASVLEISQKTLDASESGRTTAEAFRAAVERMKQDNQSIASAVDRLQRRVQQIGRIVEVINSVADRSDLLALSAELEGTRAGEVGRGFSLVSTEMRRLAENVLESTAEVEELIGEIREATRVTAQATAKGSALTDGSTALALEVTAALTQVSELARQTSDAVRTISLATQQQQTGTDQLAEAMADILGVTQQSLAATRQLGQANERLQGLATTLHGVVEHFKVVD